LKSTKHGPLARIRNSIVETHISTYRLAILRCVSALFSWRVRSLTKREEGGKTSGFLQCQEYIIKSKEYWDNLLGKENWKMLGIVDLNTGQDCIRLLP